MLQLSGESMFDKIQNANNNSDRIKATQRYTVGLPRLDDVYSDSKKIFEKDAQMQSMGSNGTINVETESEDSNDDGDSAEGSDQYSFPGASTLLKKSKKSQFRVKMPD